MIRSRDSMRSRIRIFQWCVGLMCVWAALGLSAARAAGDWPAPAVRAVGLPRFEHVGVVLDYADLKYNPHNDVISPSVVRTDTLAKPLGKYYMYYAPHDVPGGICLAYADKLGGPWKEYGNNPLIRNIWEPQGKVDHVSSPHAIWIEEENKLFVYYHGPNTVTRFASSTDGIRFTYEGVAVSGEMFDGVGMAAYASVHRYGIPGKDSRYIMLVTGFNEGHCKIYLAWSKDGRGWQSRRRPLIEPRSSIPTKEYPFKTGQPSCAWYLPWHGRHYLVYHDYAACTDLHVSEADAAFEKTNYLGVFYPHDAAGPKNASQMDACFIEEDGKLYMFSNVGPRLNQKIALAVAPLNRSPTASAGDARNPLLADWRRR